MLYTDEIDIASAKERFMGNEALFKKFLFQLPEKGMMEELNGFLEEGNAEEAFKTAHTMKGVVGNLSLNKLMAKVSDVVEVLRAKNLPGEEERQALEQAYARAMDAIEEVKSQNISLF